MIFASLNRTAQRCCPAVGWLWEGPFLNYAWLLLGAVKGRRSPANRRI
jgi:hypothetical protein